MNNTEKEKALATLETELKVINAPVSVMQIVSLLRHKKKDTLLMQLFGTDTPDKGMTVTFKEIGIRGPNGERMYKGETVAQFLNRVGDLVYRYDANTIAKKCLLINRTEHKVVCDKSNAHVTFLS